MPAANIAAIETKQSGPISLDIFADMLEAGQITESIDLGSTIVHKVLHPVAGSIVLVNTSGNKNAIIYM